MATILPDAAENQHRAPGPAQPAAHASGRVASSGQSIGDSESLRYVARQPILDERGAVHGYELLFRDGPVVAFTGDGDRATRAVLDSTVIFGLGRLTGGLPAFVNCTREALLNRLVLVLPPQQTMLELLETLKPTRDLLDACLEYKARGYRIALDDFTWSPAWQAILDIADYVKVDIEQTPAADRNDLMRRLKGSPAKLVAERVETRDDLEMVRREGFTLFQGYYFCRPVLMENRGIPANQLVHLEMLSALHREPLDTRHISNLVKRDASLTYRLLRMVNSPMYGISKTVTSIHAALIHIGDEMFRRVAMLAIASELKRDSPSELMRMAFLRARFCELAAAVTRQDPTEQYLLGLLSLLPAMLGVPMENISGAMPLRPAVHEALLGQPNSERTILSWLESYELGEWEHCDTILQSSGLAGSQLPVIYARAVEWAEANMSLAA